MLETCNSTWLPIKIVEPCIGACAYFSITAHETIRTQPLTLKHVGNVFEGGGKWTLQLTNPLHINPNTFVEIDIALRFRMAIDDNYKEHVFFV